MARNRGWPRRISIQRILGLDQNVLRNCMNSLGKGMGVLVLDRGERRDVAWAPHNYIR